MQDNTIPLTLISILADGKFYSHKQLSQYLGINSATIDSNIIILRKWGVDVFYTQEKGYILSEPIQLLNETFIQKKINKGSVTILSVVHSTNQYIFENFHTFQSGDACIAEYQQFGRGKRGTKWFSPFGSNLYLSMYWCFKKGILATIGLSLVVGITVTEILHNLGANLVQIKWPNDLYLFNRKLAGILIELTGKKGDVAKIAIGIGINLSLCSLKHNKINQNWISLKEAGILIDRNMFIVRLIRKLRDSIEQFEQDGFMPFFYKWKKFDHFMNKPVNVTNDSKKIYNIF